MKLKPIKWAIDEDSPHLSEPWEKAKIREARLYVRLHDDGTYFWMAWIGPDELDNGYAPTKDKAKQLAEEALHYELSMYFEVSDE